MDDVFLMPTIGYQGKEYFDPSYTVLEFLLYFVC